MFDVICGDLNIDNMSPCDKLAGSNLLFSKYTDPAGLEMPGRDQVCIVGLEVLGFL